MSVQTELFTALTEQNGACVINGQVSDVINVRDRGLAYGDGVFTTGLIDQGCLINQAEHLERLVESCQRLALPSPDLSSLTEQLTSFCQYHQQGVLKVMLTAGVGGRGYSRQGLLEQASQLNVIIQYSSYPEHYSEWQRKGIKLGIAETKLGVNPQLAGIKHLNRLEQVLARRELDNSEYDDLVVTDFNDCIIEVCAGNVFWLKAGKWHTPILDNAGVDGLMRQQILSKVPDVIQCRIKRNKFIELIRSEAITEIFVCNSVMGIVPVSSVFGQSLVMECGLSVQESFNG